MDRVLSTGRVMRILLKARWAEMGLPKFTVRGAADRGQRQILQDLQGHGQFHGQGQFDEKNCGW
jgi:hypothetical protein